MHMHTHTYTHARAHARTCTRTRTHGTPSKPRSGSSHARLSCACRIALLPARLHAPRGCAHHAGCAICTAGVHCASEVGLSGVKLPAPTLRGTSGNHSGRAL
eukprot:3273102-Pleurochrysis_carterae.AAC.2